MIGAAVQVLNQKRFKSFLMEMSKSRLLLKVMSNDIIKHLYKKFPTPAKSSQMKVNQHERRKLTIRKRPTYEDRRQKTPTISDGKYKCSFESYIRVFNSGPSLSRYQNKESHGKHHQPTQKSKVCKKKRSKTYFTITDSLRQRADRHVQDVCAAAECLTEKKTNLIKFAGFSAKIVNCGFM